MHPQRKTDCFDCAFSPATTALFTVLRQKLTRILVCMACAENLARLERCSGVLYTREVERASDCPSARLGKQRK